MLLAVEHGCISPCSTAKGVPEFYSIDFMGKYILLLILVTQRAPNIAHNQHIGLRKLAIMVF